MRSTWVDQSLLHRNLPLLRPRCCPLVRHDSGAQHSLPLQLAMAPPEGLTLLVWLLPRFPGWHPPAAKGQFDLRQRFRELALALRVLAFEQLIGNPDQNRSFVERIDRCFLSCVAVVAPDCSSSSGDLLARNTAKGSLIPCRVSCGCWPGEGFSNEPASCLNWPGSYPSFRFDSAWCFLCATNRFRPLDFRLQAPALGQATRDKTIWRRDNF